MSWWPPKLLGACTSAVTEMAKFGSGNWIINFDSLLTKLGIFWKWRMPNVCLSKNLIVSLYSCILTFVTIILFLPRYYVAMHFPFLSVSFNTLRPRQNGRYFPDDIFKSIFLNDNVWISIAVSLKFVPRGPINNIPALVQIMAWRRPGDKPLSEPMMG